GKHMVYKKNLMKQAFQSGKPTLGTHIFLPEPAIVEVIGNTGAYDYVEFLAEYNAFDLHDLDALARTTELMGLGSLIKLDWELNRFIAHRAVGSGFEGVLFADPRSVEDIDYAIKSVRPDEPRFGGTYGANARRMTRPEYGGSEAYMQRINDTVVGIMVEKPEMFEVLETALQNKQIDFIQWGPADYSMSSGISAEEKATKIPPVEAEVMRLCLEANIPFRVELHSVDQMKFYVDHGVRHFSIGYDIGILQDQFKRLADGVRQGMEDYL
ncbi:MAG: hypothetical protein WBA28_03210, partial [Microbacteriaceae bacterium]